MNALTIPKRYPKRSRVFLSAEVHSGSGRFEARIRDISSTGALLEANCSPEAGESVDLTCGESSMHGHVVWAERGWFGVEFEAPLQISRLVDPAGAKLKVSAPRTYRAADSLD